ncbi:hypothetical protein [Klebsiella pneumoniae]|uniref:hypothetical protein n=1 Tax=Klebsiella pneumoniae TaxID=573 RepID=UPI001D18298A|nr:hypothetical protein [Klebsiella pneumoniae]
MAVKSDMFEGLNNYLTRKQKVISTPVDVEPGVQRVVVGDVYLPVQYLLARWCSTGNEFSFSAKHTL